MFMAALALFAGVAVGRLAGRGLPRSWTPWRRPGLLVAGGSLLVVADLWIAGTPGVTVMGVGYAGLVAFSVANSARPGMLLVATGLLANLAVVSVNSGMPVRGLPPAVPASSHHHGLSRDDDLVPLADTIRLSPLGEIVSPGDILISLGGAVAVFGWLEPRRRRASPVQAA